MNLLWLTGSILIIILVVVCFSESQRNKKLLEEINKLSQMQSDLQNHYKDMESNSRELHNLKRQIEEQPYQWNKNDMEQITNFKEIGHTKYTGNYYIDYILEKRRQEAEAKSICFSIDADELSDFVCPEASIISLFDNILENAIEACERTREADAKNRDLKSVFIRFCIYERDGQFLSEFIPQYIIDDFRKKEVYHVIYMENSKSQDETPLENGFGTVKQQLEIHGNGMKIVNGIIKKYKGRSEYYDSGDMFSSCIVFSKDKNK